MKKNLIPNHIAIIMDGNGRWAIQKKQIRTFGHNAGIKTIDLVSSFALESKIKYLTLFAFSTENWNRPKPEINFLMHALKKKITNKDTINFFIKNNIKFKWLGFEKNLSTTLISSIRELELLTEEFTGMTLTIAFNYGGTQDILQSIEKCSKTGINQRQFVNNLKSNFLPDVDLLIRTGNEKRISNFLLWQSAYSEIIFEKTFWPNYNEKTWKQNLNDFKKRKRRFGKVE